MQQEEKKAKNIAPIAPTSTRIKEVQEIFEIEDIEKLRQKLVAEPTEDVKMPASLQFELDELRMENEYIEILRPIATEFTTKINKEHAEQIQKCLAQVDKAKEFYIPEIEEERFSVCGIINRVVVASYSLNKLSEKFFEELKKAEEDGDEDEKEESQKERPLVLLEQYRYNVRKEINEKLAQAREAKSALLEKILQTKATLTEIASQNDQGGENELKTKKENLKKELEAEITNFDQNLCDIFEFKTRKEYEHMIAEFEFIRYHQLIFFIVLLDEKDLLYDITLDLQKAGLEYLKAKNAVLTEDENKMTEMVNSLKEKIKKTKHSIKEIIRIKQLTLSEIFASFFIGLAQVQNHRPHKFKVIKGHVRCPYQHEICQNEVRTKIGKLRNKKYTLAHEMGLDIEEDTDLSKELFEQKNKVFEKIHAYSAVRKKRDEESKKLIENHEKLLKHIGELFYDHIGVQRRMTNDNVDVLSEDEIVDKILLIKTLRENLNWFTNLLAELFQELEINLSTNLSEQD